MGKSLGSLYATLGLDVTDFDKSLVKVQRNLKNIGQNMEQVGLRLSASIAVPLSIIGYKSVQAFRDFESAFAGVKKTVDSADGFKALEAGIRQLAKTMPSTAVGLSNIAENAGQLGVREKDILGFTKTIAMLGETTNLTTEQASTSFAQFANIVGFPIEEIEKLGSAVVALGNDGASTETEIVLLGQRLAFAGTQAGLSAQEIFGLSSALASVGVEAEAGGSSISKVLKNMNTAVISGSKDLAQLSEMIGGDFAKAFREDASDAFTLFVHGLEKVGKSGGDVQTTLDNLGWGEIRVSDALGRLSGNASLTGKAFDIANKEFERGKALLEEYEKRVVTVDSQMQITKNIIADTGITIGKTLAPQLLALNVVLSKLVDWFGNLSPAVRDFIIYFAEGMALLSASILVVGSAMVAWAGLSLVIGAIPLTMLAVGTAVTAVVATFFAFGEQIGEVITNASKVIYNFAVIGIQGSLNLGIELFVGFVNKVGGLLNSLIDFAIRPLVDAMNKAFGSDIQLNTAVFKPFEAKLIDVKDNIDALNVAWAGAGKAVDKTMEGSGNKVTEFGKRIKDLFNNHIPKVAEATDKASKEAEKAQKKLQKEIEKTQKIAKEASDSITDQIKDIQSEALKIDITKGIKEALKSGDLEALEKWKAKLTEATRQGILDGFIKKGGQLPLTPEVFKDTENLTGLVVNKTIKDLEEGIKEGFLTKELPNYLSQTITDSILNGFEEGFSSDAIGKGGQALASIFAQKFQDSFQKLFSKEEGGGFSFANISDSLVNLGISYGVSSLAQNLSDNKKDTKGGIVSGAILGASVGSYFGPYGTAVGAVAGAGAGYVAGTLGPSSNTDTMNRHDTINYIEDLIKGTTLAFLKDGNNIQEGYNSRFNTENLDNPWYRSGLNTFQQMNPIYNSTSPLLGDVQHQQDSMFVGEMNDVNPTAGVGSIAGPGWADQYWQQFGQSGGEAFNALGSAFSEMAGTMGPQMEQIGVILAENLGGNLDNARTLLQTIGLGAEDLEASFLRIGLSGEQSWHDVEIYMQKIPELTGEGLVAFGDLSGALERFRETTGRGKGALIELKNILAEATELGITNFGDLRTQMIAQGVSVEDADRLFQAFANRGINSLEDFRNASDRDLGGVTADMESLGFQWENISDNIEGSAEQIDNLQEKLSNLENKDVEVNVKINYEENNKPSVLTNANGNVFDFQGVDKSYVKKFASGGIVGSPTLFDTRMGLAGEAGPEGILPLKRMMNGDLGVQSNGMGSGAQFVINVDARGSEAGVEAKIMGAIMASQKQIMQGTISAVQQMKRRGAL